MAADYSQIELRLLAHLSEDEKPIEVFKQNGDIHTETAAAVYGVSKEQVIGEWRQAAIFTET